MTTKRASSWLLTVFAVALGAKFAAVVQAQTPAPATATPGTSAKVERPKPPFKEEELASLLAPVALYPDNIVGQVLMASTYPLEVVEAQRWLTANKTLKGEALAKEAQKQPWDPSVQALTAIPDVLKMMDEKIDWTQRVGDAMLAQQKEVLDMIQTLRKKAQDAGNLKSDDKMKVSTQAAPNTGTNAQGAPTAAPASQTAAAPQVIVIESQDPEVVYVPTYSSTSVYGAWGYPAYPPYYWPPPYPYYGAGLWYATGVAITVGFWGGAWNNDCDWHGGNINTGDINIGGGDRVDHRQDNRGDRQDNRGDNRGDRQGDRGNNASAKDRAGSGGKQWSHNAEHRKGVSYRDNASAAKFDKTSKANAASRDSFRGHTNSGQGFGGGSNFSGAGSGAGAGGRDLGGSGASAGNMGGRGTGSSGAGSGGRTLGSTPSAGNTSRGTGSSAGSGSRGSSGSSYGGSSSRGSSSSFGGMSSGRSTSSFSSRGGASRGGGGGGRGRR